jgi:glycosyltransferase involved in cell wall biosynthesis
MKCLLFAVTNDLAYDQRMIRICTSLQAAGYDVLLVGRKYAESPPLQRRPFKQKRLRCIFKKGKAFYAEYNVRLLLYGLFKKFDLVCAIDLDTILPCYALSRIKGCKRVYDAHELFPEMKEVKTRPAVYKIWKWIEQKMVPNFPKGYTVNKPIQQIFQNEYGVTYDVIRNMPLLKKIDKNDISERYIIYQGAVNEGRSFETLIPAFCAIDCPLWIYGDGNFYGEAVRLVQQHGLQKKILFKGKLAPEQLRQATSGALLGITLFENTGLSNYYSLANRFFDYIHAGIPQLCVAYPVYKELNEQYNIAVLIDDLSPASIATAINSLLHDETRMVQLRRNCARAREELNWQGEEKVLINFYQMIFSGG